MKRMVSMAIALTLAAGFTLAQTSVTSQNIVGYNTLNLSAGGIGYFTMVGSPFQTVGAGTNATVNIQDIVSPDGLTGINWGDFTGGDRLYIWDKDAQGYTQIYIWSGTVPSEYQSMGVESDKWIDESDYSTVDIDLPVGTPCWIRSWSGSSATGMQLGEVPGVEAGQDWTFRGGVSAGGFTMFSNPYPYPLDINGDMTISGLEGINWGDFTGGDRLYIWDKDAQGYTQIYIWSGTVPPEFQAMGVESDKWIDESDYSTVNVQIPIGGAFWIRSWADQDGTVAFAAP